MKLDQKISAIVAGGASGLGEATARALAALGVRVTIFDLSAEGDEIARAVNGYFCKVDVTSDDSVISGLNDARQKFGQERVLVNCAGIAPPARTVSKGLPHEMALFEKVIAVNLSGTFRMLSRSAAGMAAMDPLVGNERGVIINSASVAAFDGQMGQAAYASSKAAVAGMTLPIARDLAHAGIRVCAIAPGIFSTPMLRGLPVEAQTSLAAQVPFPTRLGNPEEFARLAIHICENSYLNGEVIRLDGAIRMGPR